MEEEDKVTLGKDWRKQKAFQSCRSVKSFKILNQIDEGTYGVVCTFSYIKFTKI